jgi:hypothetical protein
MFGYRESEGADQGDDVIMCLVLLVPKFGILVDLQVWSVDDTHSYKHRVFQRPSGLCLLAVDCIRQ